MTDQSKPIEMDFKSAVSPIVDFPATIKTLESYSFERNILVPASAFRFTAPGIDPDTRTAIRSGDMVTLQAVNAFGNKKPIGTGFIDETDTHITPSRIEYVLTGRDTLGQLVDNAVVDSASKIINIKQISLKGLFGILLQNTRMPPGFSTQQIPTGNLLFQTNAGETKINALQRYLEFTNCLVWTLPNGQAVLGKPNFSQPKQGNLSLNIKGGATNNLIEARSRRNLNQAIRKIVTQLQTLEQVDAGQFTIQNNDPDMTAVPSGATLSRARAKVGRSVYNRFSYGQGNDAVNQVTAVGNQSGNPSAIGSAISLREIARDNMKILDVEAVIGGTHFNDNGTPFNIDQIYEVQLEDDDVSEDMYVYSCSYELTLEHGMMTRLRLCRKGTIVAYADALARQAGT